MRRAFTGGRRFGEALANAVLDQSEEEEKGRAPPTMTRSVGQLASSYAPMRHFAFESGLGVCLAVPAPASEAPLPDGTQRQIRARLREATTAWFQQGQAYLANQSAVREQTLRKFVVDASLYDEANERFEFRPDVFGFVTPTEMRYEPSPTTLACGTCGLLRPCRDANDMLDHLRAAAIQCQDPRMPGRAPSQCEWRQFEPICVHPAGSWRALGTEVTDVDNGVIYKRRTVCESCGSTKFRVDTKKVALSSWFLRCAVCNVKHNLAWTDHDEDYLALLGRPEIALEDARMEKISYGASVAHTPQSETFVDLPDADALRMLESDRLDELRRFLGQRCGYVEAPPTPREALEELQRKGEGAQRLATRISDLLQVIDQIGGTEAVAAAPLVRQLEAAVAEAREQNFIASTVALPTELELKARSRNTMWASRFDPLRLAAEHDALARTKLAGGAEGARAAFVPFATPDSRLSPWRTAAEEELERPVVESAFEGLGVVRAGLIPRFQLCRFSYGFSRTSSSPAPQRGRVPVRLKLFPKTIVGDLGNVHPVYVLRQTNEAFYFKLDERRVISWLERLNCQDAALLASEPSLAGSLLTSAHPMNRFLTEHDRSSPAEGYRPPHLYAATYGLLHSMAHHVMRTMARLSGLDEGGLGEYLFPIDLAFVVYRSGMTMDLGDLSSLWRNAWRPFLAELRSYSTSLGCNVGSLCGEQGGACPDCLMIPEVSCVASNRYLSRSLLTGEGRPAFMDFPPGHPQGFLTSPGLIGAV
jgi:hypothetical protein